MDDCQAEDNAGASHLGTVEYNSSTLYRYATVNVMELAGQLGAAQAAETVRAFGEAFLFSMPTGKQNTFANRTLPEMRWGNGNAVASAGSAFTGVGRGL